MQRHAELNSENSGKKAEHQSQLADSSHLNRLLVDSQSLRTPLFTSNPRLESLSSQGHEGKGNSSDKLSIQNSSEHLPNLSLSKPQHAVRHYNSHEKVREWKTDGTANTQFRNPFQLKTQPIEHFPGRDESLKEKEQQALDAKIAEIKARIATGGMTPSSSFIQPTWMNGKGENLPVSNGNVQKIEDIRPDGKLPHESAKGLGSQIENSPGKSENSGSLVSPWKLDALSPIELVPPNSEPRPASRPEQRKDTQTSPKSSSIDSFFPPSHSVQRRQQTLAPFSVEPIDKKGPLPKHLPLPEFTAPGQTRRDGLPQINPANVKVVRAPNVSDSEMPISHAPTITPQRINQVLAEYDSPAKGMGQKVFDLGVKYGINPAMALAFYVQESSAGTRGAGARNNSWGNIRQGRNGYKAYQNIEHGLVDWYERIHQHYVGKGFHTLGRPGQRDGIIHKYAPGSDGNNEGHYIRNVANMIRKWSY